MVLSLSSSTSTLAPHATSLFLGSPTATVSLAVVPPEIQVFFKSDYTKQYCDYVASVYYCVLLCRGLLFTIFYFVEKKCAKRHAKRAIFEIILRRLCPRMREAGLVYAAALKNTMFLTNFEKKIEAYQFTLCF